jgi:hypothetical protein
LVFTDEENTSSSDGSPIPDRGMDAYIEAASKKVEITSRIIGNFNVWTQNAETLQSLMAAAFPMHSYENITHGQIALAEFLYTISVKRDSFIKWHLFRVVERGVWVGRGEKKSKVVVRNWTRRHTGDKA